MLDPLEGIKRLQERRGRPGRDLGIENLIESVRKQAGQRQKRLGELIELWTELLPPELAEATSLTGLRGGVLAVSAESSSVAFELDRRLREGLLAELRRRYQGSLSRVRVQVVAPPRNRKGQP